MSKGFSLVEILLAVTVFGLFAVSTGGAIIYSRSSTATAGNRERAVEIADEGVQAVRNIRDKSYANLINGTYGLSQSGAVWSLSGTSDTTGIYTRQVTISTIGANRKEVSSQVSWTEGVISRNVVVSSELTNWASSTSKSWATPSLYGGADIAGTNDALKVATQGNYAYIVRADGSPNFAVVNVTNPTSPTIVGTLNLTGTMTNVAVNGNYAYVTSTADNAEVQVINVTTPTAPTLAATYDAPGTADATGVFATGTSVYVTRKANGGNDEFIVLSVATPTAPTLRSWYSLNVDMNEVYVNGNDIYIVTGSSAPKILKINNLLLGLLTVAQQISLPGTTAATTVEGYGDFLIVGQGTTLYTVDGYLLNTIAGSVTLPGTINDVDVDSTHTYAFAGTSNTTGEFQVVNISSFAAPTLSGSVNLPGAQTLTGISYDTSLNVVVGASNSDTQEAVVLGPN